MLPESAFVAVVTTMVESVSDETEAADTRAVEMVAVDSAQIGPSLVVTVVSVACSSFSCLENNKGGANLDA